MNMKPSTRKTTLSGGVVLLLLSGAAFAAASGCGKSEAAPARVTTHESGAGGPKAETENYVAEIKAAGAYKAGAEGSVEVTLKVKGAYHTNQQYPYKFKAADPAPDGVTFPKPILKREDGKFDEKAGTFKIPFVAAKAGSYKIGGVFFLSVCSEANCIMDKVELTADVDVK
jgi:hypothetical protein